MQDIENPELKLAFGYLRNTGENVFLTGKAGTGKTTFLLNLKKNPLKRMVVLAPTGVAAINAGGVTIHSFFQMPFGPRIPGEPAEKAASKAQFAGNSASNQFRRFSSEKLNIIKSLDLVVIDEISMVRADLLDGIDEVLRRYRDRDKPFGGVQLLMIGDLHQLAPVVKDDEWELLKGYYDTPFFFSSKALKQSSYITIELKRIYRQSDQEFIDLLNKVRYGDRDPETLVQLNKRYKGGRVADSEDGIILTTHNYQAQRINEERMEKLEGRSHLFTARIEGDFPEYSYPTDLELALKRHAKVMFVKNDTSAPRRYFNGKIGTIQAIDDDIIYVKCPGDDSTIAVEPDIWQNMKYSLNNESGVIEETVCGTFTQYPLKPAWAITIHKSQGLTFDKVIIDAGAAFAHGQVYVALSRCRTLEGLVLTSPLTPRVLISSSSISEFNKSVEKNQPSEMELEQARITYQHTLLRELFDFSPLQKRIGFILKLMNENRGSIHSGMIDKFNIMASDVKSNITEVAEKFSSKFALYFDQEMDVEKNDQLQERVKKAVNYFIVKIEDCVGGLMKNVSVEIDNKETRNSLDKGLKRLGEETIKKTACLEACRAGFSITAYLESRAKAAIEKPAAKRTLSNPDEYIDNKKHPILYEMLKSWRIEKARSEDIPEYMILPYKTIIEICMRLPASKKEIKAIKGMGNRKLQKYGDNLLEIIERYCKENNISREIKRGEAEIVSQRGEKGYSKRITLELFKSGKTISEIAAQRGLALSTIEGHLYQFVCGGELSINQFLSPEKVSEISEFFSRQNSFELTPAKAHFGDRFSFGELRLAAGHLRRLGETGRPGEEEKLNIEQGLTI